MQQRLAGWSVGRFLDLCDRLVKAGLRGSMGNGNVFAQSPFERYYFNEMTIRSNSTGTGFDASISANWSCGARSRFVVRGPGQEFGGSMALRVPFLFALEPIST